MNFFVFVMFSLSTPSLSISLFLPYISLPLSPCISLTLSPCLSTYLSLSPASVSLSFSLPSLSLSFSTSTPVVFHSCFPFYSFIFLSPQSLLLPLFLSLSPTPVSLPIFSLCHSPAPVSLSIVLSPIPDFLSPIPVSLFIFISLTPSVSFSHTSLSLLFLSLSFSCPIFLSISLEPWSLLLSYSEVVIYIYSQFISLEFQTLYELKLN